MGKGKLQAYMGMARNMATLSPDAETQVGAIMLSEEGRIVASSFNGFVRGAVDGSLPTTRPDKYPYIQHAERNILYNCAYEGIRTKNTTVICTLSPCVECLRACFQSGVSTIIFDDLYHSFSNTDFYTELDDIFVTVEKVGMFTKLTLMEAKVREKNND